MKRMFTWSLGLAIVVAAPAFAQKKATVEGVPEMTYTAVPNFLKLPPGEYLGESVAVATNSKGHVFVYHRSANTRLFEFDQAGNFIKEIGSGYYGFEFAHSVRVDKDDNIWTVDEGSNMVIKFNPAGRVTMVIGRRPDAVDELTAMTGQGSAPNSNRPYSFNRPTDVGWDAQGNIFVTDGYGDNRVVKYDKNGRFIKSAGTAGNGRGQLRLPHTMAMDAAGNIYIGDRSNARVEVWDNDLNPKATYDQVGSPWAVCISPGPHQYLYVSNSVPDNGDSRAAAQTGEIYKMELDGTIIGKFGKAGKALKEFSTVHEIDCRNPNELFVSEITDWRVQKILLKPQMMKTSAGR
jgi:sugar lactone lactonase YvrE